MGSVTRVDGKQKRDPRPGDFSVCLSCATILRFEPDMSVAIPTQGELILVLTREPVVMTGIAYVRDLVLTANESGGLPDL
jgi:hypothetical protein